MPSQTGEAIKIKAKTTAKFYVAKAVKDAIAPVKAAAAKKYHLTFCNKNWVRWTPASFSRGRTWESIKQVMAPGAPNALTKELIYVAVSTTNNCGYCIATHTASAQKKGMTEAMFAELMAVIGMANETNNPPLDIRSRLMISSMSAAGIEPTTYCASSTSLQTSTEG